MRESSFVVSRNTWQQAQQLVERYLNGISIDDGDKTLRVVVLGSLTWRDVASRESPNSSRLGQ
jgi:hypothetical protein